MNQRLESIVQWLRHHQIDFSIFTSPSNIFYLSGFDCDPHERLLALFVFADAEPALVCPELDRTRVEEAGWKGEILGYRDSDNPWEQILVSLKKRNAHQGQTIAVEKEHLSLERAESLKHICPFANLVSTESAVQQIRVTKDNQEIQILEEAAQLADSAVEIGLKSLHLGCTELDVVAQIEYELKKKGVESMSFSTMVLFGEKSGQPHGVPGMRQLKEGDFVLFDLGVIVKGYCSDITRTFAYRSVSDKQIHIYETVLQAQSATLEMCKPGIPVRQLDETARQIITKSGYGDYFPHRTGHGLGIEVHEYPSIHDKNEEILREGMVFTIEPGVYLPDLGGVRIEDDIVITSQGARTLTRFPKELQVIE